MREYIVDSNLQNIVRADFPDYEFKIDETLFLFDKFSSLLKSGNKMTTVRYGNGKIRIPKSDRILLFETKENDKIYRRYTGFLKIFKVVIKKFRELTEADGIYDGFSGKSELVEVIEGIYGPVKPDDLVSIYHVKFE